MKASCVFVDPKKEAQKPLPLLTKRRAERTNKQNERKTDIPYKST